MPLAPVAPVVPDAAWGQLRSGSDPAWPQALAHGAPAELRASHLADAQVVRDRVRLLLESIPFALFTSYLAAGMTAWLLYPSVALESLATWLAALAIVHLARLLGWHEARRRASREHPARSLRALRLGVLATALTWTALPLFLFPPDPFDQLRLAVIVAAICGGGVSELASDALSSSLFVLPPLSALIVRMLLSHSPPMQALGLLGLVYAVYLVQGARKTERLFLEISYLRAKAADRVNIDAVTELPNRNGLNQLLDAAIARARRDGSQLAVGYADLDDFKPINDLHGHAAGDQVLRLLGQRLRQNLRDGDVIARISGDEFVVVVQAVDGECTQDDLGAVLERLHRAVDEPFRLADGECVKVEMSMGVALFPHHAQDADALLRTADAAMYQTKRRKDERERWWQLGVSHVAAPEVDAPIEPYGDEAARRLADIASIMPQVRERFIQEFYRELMLDSESHAILRVLDAAAFAQLQRSQAGYLQALFDPALTRDALHAAAARAGRAHALVGVSAAMLVKASDMFRDVLGQRLGTERLMASRRYRLFKVIEGRLKDDLQQQISTIEQTHQRYLSVLSRRRADDAALWADAARAELSALAELPGVRMVTLSRLNPQGEMVLEHSAGVPHPELTERLSHGDLQTSIDPTSPNGQTGTAIAWRTQTVHCIDSCSGDAMLRQPAMSAWHEMALSVGVQSSASIPFAGRDGHVEGVVTVYGAYPRQFASAWMRQWTLGVQHRMESVWARCSGSQRTVVSEAQRLEYRDRLFAGGLEMFYQPIVDLQTGRTVKLEALARLRMPDGRIVAPGVFIPLLGDNELGRVFREGLDQGLRSMRAWDAEGLDLGISLNLPPSVLSDPDCAEWIHDALRAHAVPPQRLTLELLELQLDDDTAQGAGMQRLRALGVGLAMDDFGAGYSNIHRLSSLRFDAIKIDQNLARQLERSPSQTTTLLGTLIRLVNDLGQTVIVEGVEELGSLEAAAVLGARFGQGYAIARPMPRDAISAWVRGYRLPVDASGRTLRTALGALAWRWRFPERAEPANDTSVQPLAMPQAASV